MGQKWYSDEWIQQIEIFVFQNLAKYHFDPHSESPLSSHDQIPWPFPTFQLITCRALTLATVAIRNEMHVSSWRFYDNYVLQYTPMG